MVSNSLLPEMTVWQPGGDGIVPSQEIRHFIENGIIRSARRISEDQIQPASIDLRLANEAYRVRASFLPGNATTLLDKAAAKGLLDRKIDLSEPALLEPNVVYIIPLMESLALPQNVHGVANPKSTTGRLDIFTRLITETGDEFDRVKRSYRGSLYVEVVSRTFPIVLEAGMTLNQLRFGRGRVTPAGDNRLKQLAQEDLLLAADDDSGGEANILRGYRITVDLQGNGSDIVAYRANRYVPPIDLSRINHYDVCDFWTPIFKNSKRQIVLEPGGFYILASKQRVRVPREYAAELVPYDPTTGEFRVHYAGFFDPGFGYGTGGEISGSKAVLEVRANEMPILLEDDQFVGRLHYYKMSEAPEKVYGGSIGSSYQQQGLTLSKQFKREQQYTSGFESTELRGGQNGKSHGNGETDTMESDDDDASLEITFPSNTSEHRIDAKANDR